MTGALEPITLAALAARPVWVAWQNEIRSGTNKPTKVPYTTARYRARADNPSTWKPRAAAEAIAALLPRPLALGGVGIEFCALNDGRNTGGVDLDSCRDPATGTIEPWAMAVIDRFASYTEVSPSGTGLKVYFTFKSADEMRLREACGRDPNGELKFGALFARRTGQDHPRAIELFLGRRYFAVTDAVLPGCTHELREVPTADILHLIRVDGPAFCGSGSAAAEGSKDAPRSRKRSAIGNRDLTRSAEAFKIGAKVRRDGRSYEAMCEAIRNDPLTGEWYWQKGVADGQRELHRIWDKADPTSGELVLSGAAPLNSARQFLLRRHTVSGIRTLHHQNGAFYVWRGSHYAERAPEEMRAALYAFLDGAKRTGDNGGLLPFEPTRNKVANVLEATAAESQLSCNIVAPAWLGAGGVLPDAREMIAFPNGLLHLPVMMMHSHTPRFFSLNALDFDYDPNAPEPAEWKKFLKTLWPNDSNAIDALQEIFGLCLTGETKYQKAFLIVGPKRSGKGTIARVLTRLLGAANVCGPTLSGLGTNFGLAPLIGKRLAVISDARISGSDQHVIVERLLAITGEDGLTIDRKFRDGWTGRLEARFLVLTNELPRLTDSSGALASRFIVLVMTQSFFGKEDLGLGGKLMAELPGILLWAAEGWRRLTARGFFVPPLSSFAATRALEDLGSPIGAFLRDRCCIGAGLGVRVDDLYTAWCDWCQQQGRDRPGTKQTFGRDLAAAVPGVCVEQPRTEDGGRVRYYQGVGLDPGYVARSPSGTRWNA